MANYAQLKAAIDAAIYTNTQRAITGDVLNALMKAMVDALGNGYQYKGAATTATNPGTPDSNVVYLASAPGTYAYFDGIVVADGELALLKYNGSWSKDSVTVGSNIDTVNVSVDNSTGTPSATGSVSGKTLTLSFHNIKGERGAAGPIGPEGPQGEQGPQGNPGSTVDYPFTLANNLETEDSTKALAAPQGPALKNMIGTIRLGKAQDGYIYIYVNGQPQGYGFDPESGEIIVPVVYGDVVTDASTLSVASEGTATLGIKLSRKPSANQSVRISSMSEYLTLSDDSLTFTEANWDTWQTVTISNSYTGMGNIESEVVIQNSDPLLTDTTIPTTVKGISYEDVVDTTIPAGAHTIEAADFASATESGSSIILTNYNAPYDNIVVPEYIDYNGNQRKVRLVGNTSFTGNTTLKYVTIAAGVGVNQYGTSDTARDWTSLFGSCTSLIGVKYGGSDITDLSNTFNGCSSLKFFDGLDRQTSCTSLYYTFNGCSALEYVQDLSGLTSVGNLQLTWSDCSTLKKVFGMMPSCNGTAVTMNSTFAYCAMLTDAVIPLNVIDIFYAFRNCTSLRRIDCLATATFTRTSNAFQNCTNLYVYCVPESDAYAKLLTDYGSSSNVHILEQGGSELPNVVVWGDSTSSPNTEWREWPLRLMDNLSGFLLKNQAVSGEDTTSTSARQGGNAISVAAFEIPATTSKVAVTATTADGRTFGSDPVFSGGGGFNPCHIGSIEGYLTSSGGVTYFNRKAAGTATSVSAGTPVTSDNDGQYNNADAVMLIQLGDNSGWDNTPGKLLNQMKLMVQHFTAKGGTKYIISGPWSGKYLRSAAGVANIQNFETLAAAEFGNHFFSLRQYLIDNGLTQNNLTASETDTERMAIGQVPGSLLGGGTPSNILMYPSTSNDDTHPNAYGANSMSLAYYQKGVALGYWTDPNNG